MKCIYINLDQASTRRAELEKNFAAHACAGWELQRFPAVDIRYVEENQIKGQLRPGEKGCLLSHQAILEENVNATAPIMIMEDDVLFGANTCDTIQNFLSVSDNYDWDIIFTDVCIPQPSTMIDLLKLRHELAAIEQVRLLDLSQMVWAGSTSYIINSRAIGKLAGYLRGQEALNLPYDLFLRKLVFEKKLKGLVFFPFITSISDEADTSAIQSNMAADTIWNAFRRLVWLNRNLDKCVPAIEKIKHELCDDESRLFGVLMAGLVSKAFVSK